MAALTRAARAAIATLAGAAYVRTILRRNRALSPLPVRDARGRRMPESIFRFSDGERVSVIDAGAGLPILWIPGADGVKETYEFQLPFFADRARVVAADLRAGFAPEHDFERFCQDQLELIDDHGLGPVVIVGQSLGSSIAMRFAERFPELVRGVVLSNPLAYIGYDHVGLNRTLLVPPSIWATRYLPTSLSWLAARLSCRLVLWIYDDSPGRDDLIVYALWVGPRTVPASVSNRRVALLKGLDLRPGLGSIRAPTLVIKGTADIYTPVEWALEIASLIPDSRYAPIPGTGHCCHISSPDEFNRLMLGWLRDEVGGEIGFGPEEDVQGSDS